jgi:hypothetical protein
MVVGWIDSRCKVQPVDYIGYFLYTTFMKNATAGESGFY